MMTIKEGVIPFAIAEETYETYFKVFGDLDVPSARPLVVLHGGPGLSYDYMLPLADIAIKHHRTPVIFYDQIGNARSTHLPNKPKSFWSIDLFLDELLNVLAHFHITDDFDVLGHSWGGTMAIEFTLCRRPAGLKHLVLADCFAATELFDRSNAQLLKAFPMEVQEGMRVRYGDMPRYRKAAETYHAVHGCTVNLVPAELKYSLGQILDDEGDRTVPIAMEDGDGELCTWSAIDRLHMIDFVPCLIINGRADMAQDFTVEPIFWRVPRAKWITFENSSHCPHWEERARYMDVVVRFLALEAT